MTNPSNTETLMFNQSHYPRTAAAAALLTFSALALTSAFAADFPIGSFAANGSTTTVTFDDKGQFQVVEKDAMVVAGQYTIKGDQLEITDVQGPWACTKAGEKTGSYAWKLNESELTFSKLADRCQDRVQSLTTTKWQRRK
jgi:hypothetical protein